MKYILDLQLFGGSGASSGLSKGRASRGQLDKIQNYDDKVVQISKDTNVDETDAKIMLDNIEYFTHYGYQYVRKGENPFAEKVIETFIERSPTYNGEIYRGMVLRGENGNAFISQLKDGAEIDMKGISSWSSDVKVAKKFASLSGFESRVILKSKNKSGVGIKHISKYASENEVIHSGKTKWKVKNVNYSYGDDKIHNYEVELEEI